MGFSFLAFRMSFSFFRNTDAKENEGFINRCLYMKNIKTDLLQETGFFEFV
jgi:hypothetical protein